MKTRLLLLIAVFLFSGLLAGCDDTDSLKSTIAEQQQEIAQLKERLEAESLQAKAMQSAVNQAMVYQWAGPLRWLPVWSDASLRLGQEMRAQGLEPDWRAWALLGTLYIAAAGILGAFAGAGISAWRRMEQSDLLQDKIREQQEQLRKGQPELERLRRIEEQVEAASEELDKTTRQIEEAERRLEKAEAAAQAAEQRARRIQSEIEHEKARVLEEYRAQLEREQRATEQAAERIAKALDQL
jgi:outer membrane murein-binding lipoprotein Lpp